MIERAEPDAKKIVSYDEREVEYDLLVSVPLNKGADVVGKSGLGDELNFSPVNKHTFLSDKLRQHLRPGRCLERPGLQGRLGGALRHRPVGRELHPLHPGQGAQADSLTGTPTALSNRALARAC